MSSILLLAGLVIGTCLGAAIGYLYARSRLGTATSELAAQARVADERAKAAAERAALVDQAANERAELIDGYLAERFQALSAQALDQSQQRLMEFSEIRLRAANLSAANDLDSRRGAIEQLVEPLKLTLTRVESQLREAEVARQSSHAALAEQVKFAMASADQLRAQTQALVTALRRPEARGRWGEMQLRRVVELAGMSARCDFDEQVTVVDRSAVNHNADEHSVRMIRPDLVVRLAGGKNIVVDSKVSLAAYLEAAETAGDGERDARLDAHARHVKDHVDQLAAKAYWTALSPAPEFVVLFIPGEAFLAPALEREPGLLEYAMARKVHIATPTTLVSMLRTAQYAWQQAALSENARAVFDLGHELYDRLGGFAGHLDVVGKALANAATAYNRAVGSMESRILVTARKLNQLGVTDAELEQPKPVEVSVRPLSAPELVEYPAVGQLPSQAEPALLPEARELPAPTRP